MLNVSRYDNFVVKCIKFKHKSPQQRKADMHSMNWHQRNRNVNRFFFKRTGFFSPRHSQPFLSVPAHSAHCSRHVPDPPPRGSAQVQGAGDEATNQQGEKRETALQQAKLRAGKKDETS